ncbi:MAG: hypothetical protein ACLUHA_12840 [Bacteroides stercoris]
MYIPISEMRNVGTLLDIDIIGSARELKELIEKQQEAMQGSEDIDPGFSVTPRRGRGNRPRFQSGTEPDSDSGASEEGDGSVTGPEQPAGQRLTEKERRQTMNQNQVTASLAIVAVSNGTTVNGYVRVDNGPLIQAWTKGSDKYTPGF